MPQFDTPINTNDQSVDRVLANSLPVMLILHGNGALNSALNSTLDDIARAERGKLLVAKLNTTDNPATAKRFGARGGTTLVTWNSESEQARLDSPSPEQVRAAADHLLGRGPKPTQPKQPPPTETHSHGHPITVNESNFDQHVLQSDQPVLVDFWAAWCGPCRMIAPTLDKLAQEYAGKLRIAKLNIDENPHLAAKYRAHSIPLLVMFKGGRPVNQLVGAHPEANIRRIVDQALL
jgi:thioredoxin 1